MATLRFNLRDRLMPLLVECVQEVGAELAAKLQVDVDHECPAYHHKGRGHSLPGQIPFKESGAGQESIGVQNTDDGVRVGVAAIPGDKLPPNHLLLHDPKFSDGWGERPWLSNWRERHWDSFKENLIDEVRDRLGGTVREATA